MTNAENERLAVVESKVETLTQTVNKFDGKLDAVHTYVVGQQTREIVEKEQSAYRRWIVPIVVTIINTAIALAGILVRISPH